MNEITLRRLHATFAQLLKRLQVETDAGRRAQLRRQLVAIAHAIRVQAKDQARALAHELTR